MNNVQKARLSGTLGQKIVQIAAYLSHSEDLKIQKLSFRDQSCAILYVDVLVKPESVQSNIMQPLKESVSGNVEQNLVAFAVNKSPELVRVGQLLLEGCCAIITAEDEAAIMVRVPQAHNRSIEEPRAEQVVKGPHDGFIEDLSTNIYLLRNRIKHPNFKVNYMTFGTVTNTRTAMIYMDRLANPAIVAECEKRLGELELDYLYSAGNLDEMLEEHPMSPFPQTLQTERPDRVVSYLMEGKIALIVDGSPSVLILPITFFSFYQSPDDYNSRWLTGSFFRFIRLISFILAICLPAIYIAIVTYHSEVLPIGILYSVKVSLTYVPLTPILEAILMQIILELLKEAAIRLPNPISQTIGIVGGLVIGTAVVEAQLVSHTMIVVIGLTAIASFVTPINEFGTSLRILGFPMMAAAAMFGFFGIAIMLMLIFIHLCKIQTLGVPYFTPFGPYQGKNSFKDVLLRVPLWTFNKTERTREGSLVKQAVFGRWKRR
ncbi:spore germination protein [Paenibacillus sacheonensis]|uniref:Spore germination protein n=1 Tax=Paenibacillus sacheonensis TaxID=742054 RepID=A0A7X4YL64_9BACL|nr:spore germination protein [Paenibacillus sacheonensis]MBM7564268.1 spore germination protein KA [Paenibacillus sacheonensis]NBC67409.1 spore germination protein [Paenibacillus sacheonensis]